MNPVAPNRPSPAQNWLIGTWVFALLAASLSSRAATFGEDLTFLRKHTTPIVLADSPAGMRVAVIPSMQGRVMMPAECSGWLSRRLPAL